MKIIDINSDDLITLSHLCEILQTKSQKIVSKSQNFDQNFSKLIAK